jgi:hypothetical protein
MKRLPQRMLCIPLAPVFVAVGVVAIAFSVILFIVACYAWVDTRQYNIRIDVRPTDAFGLGPALCAGLFYGTWTGDWSWYKLDD